MDYSTEDLEEFIDVLNRNVLYYCTFDKQDQIQIALEILLKYENTPLRYAIRKNLNVKWDPVKKRHVLKDTFYNNSFEAFEENWMELVCEYASEIFQNYI